MYRWHNSGSYKPFQEIKALAHTVFPVEELRRIDKLSAIPFR